MAIPLPDLLEELDGRLEGMGFELVEATWVGSRQRPILRIKMDLPDSMPGKGGVSVDQCAEVSRALGPWLDEHPGIPERFTLEVSSPGVERPVTKPRDWERFRGQQVVVKGKSLPQGVGNRVEGEILGMEQGEGEVVKVAIRLASGERMLIPLDRIQKAHLVFRWD
ncbi:MAG: ribosome maturation factor RimP [Longimicrobiales bacterium]